VAVNDRGGGLADPAGLPLDELVAWKASGYCVAGFGRGTVGPPEAPLATECDILAPAARPDAITDANVEGIKARVVLEVPTSRSRRGRRRCSTSVACFVYQTGTSTLEA
jgi:glutamate dehydrogenase/leucine dehydrogenase